MNKIIEFFKKKWVIQLLGIIALGLLIWFFGPLLAIAGHVPLESELSRLVTILVIVIVWLLIKVWGLVKANRANQAMANDLVGAQAAPDKAYLEKESDEEIGAISKNFDEALQTLKKMQSKSSHGKHYLYDLPWYIIIGPPGSGKTTALVNSGLEFPLADKFGKGALRGVGGTRNCDWWFTDDAVLLDTAGRYTTQDSHEAVDKAAWLGFLDLLKKHRPRRPVNGVLITMSLSDLLKQTEEERSLHAQSIRQRIEELHTQFGIRFPIYMIFTKADLVAGFNDFFADLTKEERMQVWGVTFPEENQAAPADVTLRVGKDFDDLLVRLNAHMPRRLQEERDLQRRHLIFGFPQRMALLRESLLSFLQECYGVNRYQSMPYLRGIYFTSGTQEGTPIDRLMGILANTFKLDRFSVPLFSGKGKSFFITRLLKEVVFEEALIAGLNQRVERMQTLLRQGSYISALVIILLMSGLWFTSYSKNQTALGELDKQLQQYDKVVTATPNWQTDFSALLKRMNALQAVGTVYKDDVPWLMTFGLYQGDKLQPVIHESYEQILLKQFLPLIKTRLEQRLNGPEAGNTEVQYELLKVYLMLGDPKKLESGLVRLWVAVDWTKTFGQDQDIQAKLLEHLDNLLKLKFEPQKLNEQLIAAARQVLSRIPPAQQVYMRIKSESLQDQSKDLQLNSVLAPNGNRVFMSAKGKLEQLSIPYLFTYNGFYDYFLKQSKDQAEETINNNWVLGDVAKAQAIDADQLQQGIQSYYYSDFIKVWDELLANLKIKDINSAQESTEVLQYASAPDSPIKKLLLLVDKETSLTRQPPSALEAIDKAKAAGAAASVNPMSGRMEQLLKVAKAADNAQKPAEPLGAEVERHFEPLTSLVRASTPGAPVPLDQTMATLNDLYGYMIDSTRSGGVTALNAAKQGGGGNAVDKLKIESGHLPEPLRTMTQALASGNQGVIMDNSKTQLNKLWQGDVVPLYKSGLAGRYPLSKRSNIEVTLLDFGRFFAQGGVLDTFFNTNLKAFVDQSGTSWTFIPQGSQSIGISASVLRQFQNAEKIRQVFFASGSQTPLIKFNLKPISLDANASRFWINLEGQQTDYRHGPTLSAQFQWPGTDGSGTVRYGFETLDGKQLSRQEDGAWAWFRVLDQAQIQKTAQDKYEVTFTIEGLQARYELSANSVDNPFALKELQNFQFPLGL